MKNEKEEYRSPEIKIIVFSANDILTDSIPLPYDTLEP